MSQENTGIDGLMKGWYSEVNSQWPGQAMSLEVEKVLLDTKSEYQHVIVFKSKTFGNVLVLDGVIQLTERDEMAYQEMIAHLPLFAHPDPKSVLIIGGGDGGVIREVVKHKGVKDITICEIDQVVIDAGKKYFPSVAAAWDDKRVTLVCGDASKYVEKEENKDKFDVIICDSSDPVGPAQVLFETKFYRDMYNCLKAGGRACTQAESIWMHLELIGKLVKEASGIYAAVEYATTQIPTYPCGQIGFLLCTKEGGKGRSRLTSNAPRPIPRGDEDLFRFYTHELHSASFVLPRFVQKVIDEKLEEAKEEKAAQKAEATKAAREKRKSKGGSSPKASPRKDDKDDKDADADAEMGDDKEKEKEEEKETPSKKAKTEA